MLVDTTYFSAGFYHWEISRPGRDFNITFHSIVYNEQSEELDITEQFSLKEDRSWINCKQLAIWSQYSGQISITRGIYTYRSSYLPNEINFEEL